MKIRINHCPFDSRHKHVIIYTAALVSCPNSIFHLMELINESITIGELNESIYID